MGDSNSVTNIFRYYEFFAGGGMARAGLGKNWSCLYANDIDIKKAASYAQNWGDEELHVKDINAVATCELPEKADLVWASFPCQDLSIAGNGSGLKGERSGTFWPFWRLVEDLKKEGRAPRIIAIENVCGALTSHNGEDFAAIAQAIVTSGYNYGALVMDAIKFVPQSRPRLFIVAVQQGISIPGPIIRENPDTQWHSPALVEAFNKLSQVCQEKWIWWSLPNPPIQKTVLADLIDDKSTRLKWHTREQTRYLVSMMSEVNRKKVTEAKKAGSRKVGTIYRRMRPDGNGGRTQRAEIRFDDVAGCLRTPAGGSSRQIIMIIEGSKIRSRLLSPIEAANLMGLPGDYLLPENHNDAYILAGDGLVVPVVRYLASNVLEPILSALADTKDQDAA